MELKNFNKKAYFFSVDSFIGIMLVLAIIIIVKPQSQDISYESRVQEDLLKSMSEIKMYDLNNSYVLALIANGTLVENNNSVLEEIGDFYALNDPLAKNVAQNILDELNLDLNVALYYGDSLIANNSIVNYSSSENIRTSRFLISGIMGGINASSGFSSRAFLFSENKIKYFYFGGYVGDGNVTVNIGDDVTSASIEGDFLENFSLYINDLYVNNYNVNPGIPFTIDLSSHGSKFNSGKNNISFKSNSSFAIAGGFIRVVYNDSNFDDKVKFLPGIEGLINLYDGFRVPGNLTGLDIFLHYNSTYNLFMTIGDIEVYRGNSSGNELNISINNATLFGLLNYSLFSENTVPFRVGILNVSDIEGTTQDSDVYSVTDLSGSMDDNCNPSSCEYSCGSCIGDCGICDAKAANDLLVDFIMDYSGNRVGLSGYESTAKDADFHELSNDSGSLKSTVLNQWDASGNTCICCGINKAVTGFDVGTVKSRVSGDYNDAEELISNGDMFTRNVDLELIYDSYHGGEQEVGMRFLNINIPSGMNISSAYIEFETDETDSGETHLTFSAEDIDDAPIFSNSDYDITSRTKTSSKVTWFNVPAWNTVSEKHQTPDISSIIKEVVDRPGWESGNSIAVIVNGSGERTAEAYDGESANAPLLVVSYHKIDCGNGTVDFGEECDDGNLINGDGCNVLCEDESLKSMIVMSDGSANRQCSEQGTGSSSEDAIQAACDAYNNDGITVHAIGFGSGADETTMQDIASCGQGNYYFGNVSNLEVIYQQIADDILQASYDEQRITGNGSIMKLYSDSNITLEYESVSAPYGLEITSESSLFGNTVADGFFNLPNDSTSYRTGVVSYSGSKWTSLVQVYNNTSSSWMPIFNLTDYGFTYTDLGDPYILNIPTEKIVSGRNDIRVITAVDSDNNSVSNSSIYNKIIYTIIKDIAAYSPVLPSANGCIWHIEFEDFTNTTMYFPSSYNGSDDCYFASDDYFFPGDNVILANTQDAVMVSILNLLEILDLNNNNRIETKFSNSDLDLSSVEIEGLPFTVATEVQVRTWR